MDATAYFSENKGRNKSDNDDGLMFYIPINFI